MITKQHVFMSAMLCAVAFLVWPIASEPAAEELDPHTDGTYGEEHEGRGGDNSFGIRATGPGKDPVAFPASLTPDLLPDNVLRIVEEIESASSDRDFPNEQERTEISLEEESFAELASRVEPDPDAPYNALVYISRRLNDTIPSIESVAMKPLRRALTAVEMARSSFYGGSTKDDLSHLRMSVVGIQRALIHLRLAGKQLHRTGTTAAGAGVIDHLQVKVTYVARRMAESILTVLRSKQRASASTHKGHFNRLAAAESRFEAGLKALAKAEYVLATNHFGGALNLASNSLRFDVEVFEQNIEDALSGKVVGYALSIAWKGNLYQGGSSSGPARTDADPPALNQDPAKEMHVASVSKTLTTIILLPLLEQNGLTPDSNIADYLPSDWSLGTGADALTFRDLLTHRSGFGQISAGNSYKELRDAIADNNREFANFCPKSNSNVVPKGFCYNNGNFGLVRVLTSGLLGIDVAGMENPDITTAAIFLSLAENTYNGIGVGVDCRPNDPDPTIQYNFPHNDQQGYLEPDRRLTCGGFGWHVSSNELAGIMAFLRLTNELLSDQARDWMEGGFLGYMSPSNYGWIGDTYGTYYMHGGDWYHDSGEAHACALAFPIQVQVGLVINSARAAGMDYQCLLVQTAFEDAWVANN